MKTLLLVGLFYLIVHACFTIHRLWKSKREKEVIAEEVNTFEALINWRLANPNLYIGDVPYARCLVLRRIEAWRKYLSIFSFLKDDGFIDFLYGLLDEHGPGPPSKSFPVLQQPRREDGVVLILQRHNWSPSPWHYKIRFRSPSYYHSC